MPTLPAGALRPHCRICGQLLTAFLQTEIPVGLDTPFLAGSRLTVFACPTHDDVPATLPPGQLPERFWERNDGHYAAYFVKPAFDVMAHPSDGRITPVGLALEIVEEDALPEPGFKIGGAPAFPDERVDYWCSCGAHLALVCQLPAGLEIPIEPDAPRQPNGQSDDTYVLFRGKETYVLACASQCDPRAVLAIVAR